MKQQRFPQQDLADRLRDALDEAGVSQADLARACDVTDQAVHDWLKTGRVGKQHFVTICHLTKKDFSYFFVGLKTWRRAAAIALISLSLPPLALLPSGEVRAAQSDNVSRLCIMLNRMRRWLKQMSRFPYGRSPMSAKLGMIG